MFIYFGKISQFVSENVREAKLDRLMEFLENSRWDDGKKRMGKILYTETDRERRTREFDYGNIETAARWNAGHCVIDR